MKTGKENEQLKVLPLLMAPRRPEQLRIPEEKLPDDEQVRSVLLSIFDLGIHGPLVPIGGAKSTSEWDENIFTFLKKISIMAKLSKPVLIIGESGTGKESMARLIHSVGRGKDKPFEILDCTLATETFIGDTLFGHEKGAFTGAIAKVKGCIEQAEGGTCFIDEIGKMPTNLQSKLLRVIEYKEFKRLGGIENIKVADVKFVISLQPGEIEDNNKILPDLGNRLSPDSAITLPSLKEILKSDPYIIYAVLNKLLQRDDMKKVLVGDITHLKDQAKEALESFKRELETKDLPTDQPDVILKNQEVIPKANWQKSLKKWDEYLKVQYQISLKEKPLVLSDRALEKLVKYEGYDGNFRKLDSILWEAILNAMAASRRNSKEILVEDLPSKVRSPQTKEVKTTPEREMYDVKDILLKDILSHADNIRSSIIRRKVEEVYKDGQEIKTTLFSEGIKTESEYQNFRNKIERILGSGSLKIIRE